MDNAEIYRSPSPKIVLPYYFTGGFIFLLSTILLTLSSDSLLGHYFQPVLLSVTHLLVLGWATMIIFGALHQLIPVLLEANIYSEKLAWYAYWLLTGGTLLLAISFWHFHLGWMFQVAATAIGFAVTLFLYNVIRTVSLSGKKSIETDYISTSVIWLLITVLAGATLGLNLTMGFLSQDHLIYLKVHAHLGITGWFLLLIIGVASKLIPMFLLAKNARTLYLDIAYYLINIGLIGFAFDTITTGTSRFNFIFTSLISAGILSFCGFVISAYRSRVRRKTDTAMKQALMGFVVLLAPLIIAQVLVFSSHGSTFRPALTMIYGVTILFGFISMLILGKTFKTLPFILLLHAKREGRKNIRQEDFYSTRILKLQILPSAAALFFIVTGIALSNSFVVKTGSMLLSITAILFNINLMLMLIRFTRKSA